jgi:membrane-bound serine protease (ClpP class)
MITQPVRPTLISEEHTGNLAILSTVIVAPFAGFFGFITYKAWKAKTKKPLQFTLPDEVGTALDPISDIRPGFVLVGGEYWRAKTRGAEIKKGDKIKIIGKEADMLVVEPLPESK